MSREVGGTFVVVASIVVVVVIVVPPIAIVVAVIVTVAGLDFEASTLTLARDWVEFTLTL